ncbi:MAG: DUF6807 family protein [Verrucomicrobiota bacterium]|nr:PmoA family protein [Limisphaera sp.]MDW8382094.1 DUF6807 family protein [Verrucomicrobiota bacterium]
MISETKAARTTYGPSGSTGMRSLRITIPTAAVATIILICACQNSGSLLESRTRIAFQRNDAQGELTVLIEGRPAFGYVYSREWDLPHFYPIFSPSGRSMTVQKADPYPHHRSLWIADRVQLAGHRVADFYNAWYTGEGSPPHLRAPFRDRIRHDRFTYQRARPGRGVLGWNLIWEMDHGRIPILNEMRQLEVVALGRGEYFLDLTFTLTAAYGPVTFRSDAVHYAWPYVRLNDQFNTNGMAQLANSEGQFGQVGTNDRQARWVDFSQRGAPEPEGLALFSHPSNPHPHTWLTRDYGTFGPRREASRNGKHFLLPQGGSISYRVGVLVHRGDVHAGRVAERYDAWAAGRL